MADLLPRLRIVYFSSGGIFSALPLKHLLSSGEQVCAIVTAEALPIQQSRKAFPLLGEAVRHSVFGLAETHHIPVCFAPVMTDDLLSRLTDYQPDIIFVSCFPWRLPHEILSLPTLGCFNLHPSLLPQYRGPMPLFWQFHQGERQSGVSLHQMDSGWDTGALFAQQTVILPEGVTAREMSVKLATIGGRLMCRCLRHLRHKQMTLTKQPLRVRYWSHPEQEVFQLSLRQPARTLYHFLCGTRRFGRLYRLSIEGQEFDVQSAIACYDNLFLEKDFEWRNSHLWLKCVPGILQVRARPV
jgi:methionyl-tRNA formyltransferase